MPLSSVPVTFAQIEGIRHANFSAPRAQSARQRRVVPSVATAGTVFSPKRKVFSISNEAKRSAEEISLTHSSARVPKPPSSPPAPHDEPDASDELLKAKLNCHRRYKSAHKQVEKWQKSLVNERQLFESECVFIETTRAIAQHSQPNTADGKMLRVEAALQILKTLSSLLEPRYGRTYEWAIAQCVDAIFHTKETAPYRDATQCERSREVETACQTSCDGGDDFHPPYFQLYDMSLISYGRLIDQNEKQQGSLQSLHGVLDCALNVYRLKIKCFVFNSWWKYRKVSRSQNKSLAKIVKRFFQKSKLRRIIQSWSAWAKQEQSELKRKELEEANKRLIPLVKSLEAKLESLRCTSKQEFEALKVDLEEGKQTYDDYVMSSELQITDLETLVEEQTSKSASLADSLDIKTRLLNDLAPGYMNRVPPCKELVWASSKLKDLVVNCRATLKFPTMQLRAVEDVVIAWVKSATDCKYNLTIADLATEYVYVLDDLLMGIAKENAPQGESSTVEKFRACFAKAEINAPPLNLLAHTHTMSATLTGDFMNTPLFNAKLLKVLCSLFLAYECYSHLNMTSWSVTSCETSARTARLDKLGKSEKKKPTERRAARVLHTLKTIQQSYTDDDGDLYAGVHQGQEEVYDEVFDKEYEEFMSTLTPLSCNRAWTGIGTLISLFLGRAKQKQMVGAISQSTKTPMGDADSDDDWG